MPTRVLEVLGRSAGGIAKHVATIQRALDGHDGFTVDVAGPPDLPIAMMRAPIDLEIPSGPLGHRAARRKLRELIAGGEYDVVHAHGLRAGMDAGRAAQSTSSLRVVTIHNLVRADIVGAARARAYQRAEKLAVRDNDRVLAVSQDIARHLEGRSPASHVEVMHLGIESPEGRRRTTGEVRRELKVPDAVPLLVTVARLDAQKALHVLIDAVKALQPLTAMVVGTGSLQTELERRVTEAGIADRFKLLGWRDDVSDLVAAADVFCLSSVWEGVPLAAQEAIALDTPVVATDVGGMRDLIEDGVSGRLVPAGDPRSLAAAISDVLDDPERAAGFARAAKAHLSEEFSTSRMLDRLRTIYSARRD
ncbi:MAG: glycosyltransferase family 4 protein [Actinomycetota bacterium]